MATDEEKYDKLITRAWLEDKRKAECELQGIEYKPWNKYSSSWFGHTFYATAKPEGSNTSYYPDRVTECMMAKEKITETSFLIAKDKVIKSGKVVKQYAVFTSKEDFYKWQSKIPMDKRNFYELIPTDKFRKPYFDIDLKYSEHKMTEEQGKQLMDTVMLAISEELLKLEIKDSVYGFLLLNASTPEKLSYHIIIDGLYHNNNMEAGTFFRMINEHLPEDIRKANILDSAPYGVFQCWRMLDNSKINKNNKLTIVHDEAYEGIPDEQIFYRTLATNVQGCTPIPIVMKPKPAKRIMAPRELAPGEYSKAIDLWSKHPMSEQFEVEGLMKGYLITLKRKCKGVCTIHNKQHDSENAFLILYKNGAVQLRCRRSPEDSFEGEYLNRDAETEMENGEEFRFGEIVIDFKQKQSILAEPEKQKPILQLDIKQTFTDWCMTKPAEFEYSVYNPTDLCIANYIRKGDRGIKFCNGNYYKWEMATKLWVATTQDILKLETFNRIIDDCKECLWNIAEEDIMTKVRVLKNICEGNKKRNDVFSVLKGFITDIDFENNIDKITPWIPTNDGKIINIFTQECRDRTPQDLYTHTINAHYKEQTTEEELTFVNNFYSKLFGDNMELKKFFIQTQGIYISGDMRDKSFLFCYGEGGNNGKTVCMKVLNVLLGKYYHAASSGVFFKGVGTSANAHTAHLTPLMKARTSVIGECEVSQTIDAKQMKLLTGSDVIAFRGLGKEEVQAMVNSHCILVGNKIPKIVADQATQNRARVLPFNSTFIAGLPKDKEGNGTYCAIKDMEEQLTTPNNLNLIFYLFVQGAKEYYKNDYVYNIPDEVKTATTTFVMDGFIYSDFIDEYCEVNSTARIGVTDLYTKYKSIYGETSDSSRKFGEHMSARFTKFKSGVMLYKGIKLKENKSE